MTPAVTGFSISISDDGTVHVSAANAEQEGHTWAIKARPITATRLRQVAAILGPDAVEGVEKRLAMVLDRADREAARTEVLVQRAREAKERAEALRAELATTVHDLPGDAQVVER